MDVNLRGPHEVGSQVPRVPAMACRVSFNVGGCILSVDMAIQSGIQSFFLAMAGHDWSCLAMGAISGHAPPRPAGPSHGWAHTAGHALICLTSMTLRLFCERSFS